tara:strand:- start:11464 stop:13995 length:2532 start_codon:yes stop_codon:yes gene_type:complete
MKTNLSIKLAHKELKQGWKHFAVFLSCLILGVTIMAGVNTLGTVVKNSLNQEAQSLLGGDLEVRIRGVEATPKQQDFIAQYGRVSQVATLRTMMHFKNQNSLIELKAVDERYPLIGSLDLEAKSGAISKQEALKDNGIAVDPVLVTQYGLELGDEVNIGSNTFILRAFIKKEPDRAVQILTFGPRVIMSKASLATTGLVSTFSLVDHRYRILSSETQVLNENYDKQVEQALIEAFPDTSWRVSSGADNNNTLKRFLNQLIAFLNLSGLATFLIAGIGIGSSVRTYLDKKSVTIAVLKVQGASKRTILQTYMYVIGFLSLVGGVVGASIAGILTTTSMPLLQTLLPTLEGQSGFNLTASLLAVWYGILITYLFSIPAIFSAVDIKSASLFRSKTASLMLSKSPVSSAVTTVLLVLLSVTLFINAPDKLMIIGTFGVIAVSFIIFSLCTFALKKITRSIKVKKPWLKLALGNIYRPGSSTGTIVFAIGTSLTVLIALTLTEANFQMRIKDIAETQAPSLFMIDIQPHQEQALEQLLYEYAKPEDVMLSPMVRGRITALNGTPVEDIEVDEDVSWAVRGDRGISYSAKPLANSNIVEGEWWAADYTGEPLLSVDERFLKGMGLKVGDTMTLRILGEDITAKITSARKIDYTSFQLNFALMLSPGEINEYPHTSLATVFLDKHSNDDDEIIKRMASEFPGVTAIKTKEVVGLIENIMGHIATALSITVGISLFAGLLVLTSALNATIKQRMYDIAVLKVLGARKSDILKSCSAEWLFIALVAAILSSVIGTGAAMMINAQLKGQEFVFLPGVLGVTLVLCLIVIWCIGYIGNRTLFKFRPGTLLRNE